jgi:UPF0148 protein
LSRTSKDKMKLTVELVKRGATIMGEPCPTCGGIQARYHGKVYCTQHEDIGAVLSTEEVSMETVTAGTREVVLAKLKELNAALEKEKDVSKQEQLVALMNRCVELLQKIPPK